MGQIELFSLNEMDDRVFYYDNPSHGMNDTSTRTKRPKGKAIAPLPKTAIALPPSTANTI